MRTLFSLKDDGPIIGHELKCKECENSGPTDNG